MSFPVFLVIGDLYMNSCNSCVLDTNGTLTYCKSCIGKYNDRLKNGTNPIMFDVNKKFITNEIERMGIRKVVSLYYNTYKKEIKEICKEHYNNNKEYYADYQLNYKYNITLEEKNDMIKKQDNKCLMCGKDNKAKRGLNVDHCHKTGKVRGLLCHRCNVGISYLEDKEFVSMANKYLSKYEETDMYFDREINSIISLSSV